MNIYPGKIRKDGKIPVQFVFPISGQRHTRLMTPEQLLEAQIKESDKRAAEKAAAELDAAKSWVAK